MPTVPMTHYPLIGEVLTPTHIGDGTTLTPLEYVVKDRHIIRLRLETLLHTLSEDEQEEIEDYLDSDITVFREWLQQQFDERAEENFPPGVIISRSEMSKNFYRAYRELGPVFELQPLIYHPLEGMPYLPGSSLKGALRTAVIDQHANKKLRKYSFWHDSKTGFKHDRNFEFSQKALACQFFSTDPFRAIRINDALVWDNKTQYLSIYNLGLHREGHLNGHPHTLLHLETLQPGVQFSTVLSVTTALQKLNQTMKKKDRWLSLELSEQDLIQACQKYYSPQAIEAEMDRFFKFHPQGREHLQHVLDIAHHLAPNEFLLRIGRYSHFEYKSVHNFRVLQDINHAVPTHEGCSRSLGEFYYPLGWLKMTLLNPEEPGETEGKSVFFENLQLWKEQLYAFQIRQQTRRQLMIKHQESLIQQEAEQAAKLQREQEAIRQREIDEATRKAKMSPLEVSIEDIILAHPTQADYITLLQALSQGHWKERADQKAVALIIQHHMQTIKVWKETSQAKHPDKDKNYQRTQEVLKYIRDSS